MFYYFLKISNNNNACVDFCIDITVMKDCRLRISTLKSQYKRYKKNPGNIKFKEAWNYLDLDYSFYCLDSRYCENYEEAKNHALDLMDLQYSKMNENENN